MIFALPKTETQLELEKVREEVNLLKRQINELSARIAAFPQPLRPRWERHSRPNWDVETLTLPTVRQPSRKLAKPPALIPMIDRVTVCMSGYEQFVHVYDQHGHAISDLCGPFREVGLKVLRAAGNLPWETVAESA